MIHIKDGGVSSYKRLYELTPKAGETFISQDGTVLVFIIRSGYVRWLRTDQPTRLTTLEDGTVAEVTAHHNFKRVEVDLTIRAV